ncbi:hypothetical protein LIPSTDRAFT_3175 [Lipomyces starkeyi NRRL Y-11557]|uniref:BED-type domain-containing protein n=1 Tax=Lipomyces starkeyi NRRL Y-11557 TaxID=675824 RepID=A0A1E3QAE0_LIPST|nr:hypothetical protein LIPSTDRAFT_3175 [Lipomyces starkeyi NRRL Y-11557]
MTSQASDILSQLDGELLEIPDSPIDQLPSSLSQAMSTATATKPKRYSKVWLRTPVGRNDVILNKEGNSIWRCKYCATEYREPGGTIAIANHLKERHNVNISSAQEARTTLMQANIAEAFKIAQQAPGYKRRRLSGGELDPALVEQLTLREMDYDLWHLISHGHIARV